MRLVAISDTHNMHSMINMPSGDICIHSGDATGRGDEHELKSFIEWYSNLDFQYKIYVPGNHDIGLENNLDEWRILFEDAGIILLNDESVVLSGTSSHDWEPFDVKIHGSPITPNFGNWAFMKPRGEIINKHWMKIPQDTDILVTHGPPYGILDEVYDTWRGGTEHTGCEMLWSRVCQVNPKMHIFGHIHEGAGEFKVHKTEFINASMLDERYNLIHSPIIKDI